MIKAFPHIPADRVRNFWMNHKFKGLQLLKVSERGVRFRSMKLEKSKRIFKGKSLIVTFR